jgi:hypothetical protein
MNVQEKLTAFVEAFLNPLLIERELPSFNVIVQGFSDPLSSAIEYPRANIVETGRSFNVEDFTTSHSLLLGLAIQTEESDVLKKWMTDYTETVEEVMRSNPHLGGWCLLSDVNIETDARTGIGLIAITIKIEVEASE